MTDKEFNNRLLAIYDGDREAMKSIYDEYYAFIYFTALSCVKNKMMAEDIASEVLITLFSKKGTQSYINNPKTFLYVMTVNKSKNLLKSKDYLTEELVLDTTYDEYQNDFCSVEISDLLLKIPKLDRDIFVAHLFWGFTFLEISKRYSISLATIKRKYKKVCDYMVKHLNAEKYD